MGYVQFTQPTIWIPDQYIRKQDDEGGTGNPAEGACYVQINLKKQDGVHLCRIQMVGLSGCQMAF